MANNTTAVSGGIRLSQTSYRCWKDLVDADCRFDRNVRKLVNVHYELACFLGDAYAASFLMSKQVLLDHGRHCEALPFIEVLGQDTISGPSSAPFGRRGGAWVLHFLSSFYGGPHKVPGQLLTYNGRICGILMNDAQLLAVLSSLYKYQTWPNASSQNYITNPNQRQVHHHQPQPEQRHKHQYQHQRGYQLQHQPLQKNQPSQPRYGQQSQIQPSQKPDRYHPYAGTRIRASSQTTSLHESQQQPCQLPLRTEDWMPSTTGTTSASADVDAENCVSEVNFEDWLVSTLSS